jgi:hypothetical protein
MSFRVVGYHWAFSQGEQAPSIDVNQQVKHAMQLPLQAVAMMIGCTFYLGTLGNRGVELTATLPVSLGHDESDSIIGLPTAANRGPG